VNKVDNSARLLESAEFYSLGFEHNYFLSSISGSGTGELLDDIAALMPNLDEEEVDANAIPRFAIIGQPNVGKSSLLNALVGSERTIVSDIAGTTRDTIHTHYKLFQKEFVLIDTAGIRRKARVDEDLEFYSVIRAIKAVDEADVCLLLIDAEKGITQQDLNIFSLASKKGKGIVLLVNKWDLLERETNTARDQEKELKQRLAIQRCPHPLHFCKGKTEDIQGHRDCIGSAREQTPESAYLQTQRRDAEGHRIIPSARCQRQYRQGEIRHAVAHRGAEFRILLQLSG
jgi:GTP-binding protein